MTRINVIEPQHLSNKHLLAEYREITRVFTQVRKANVKGVQYRPSSKYTLGTGHVTFFTDKLQWVLRRYGCLARELLQRGYKINPVLTEDLLEGISNDQFKDYFPNADALVINLKRLVARNTDSKHTLYEQMLEVYSKV